MFWVVDTGQRHNQVCKSKGDNGTRMPYSLLQIDIIIPLYILASKTDYTNKTHADLVE